MKRDQVTVLILTAVLGSSGSALAQPNVASLQQSTNTPPEVAGPRAEFAGLSFDFGKVESGQVIRHDFIFTNAGTRSLDISDVRTSCGCTAAGTWDKRVEPGATGKIPIQFNSAGYGGSTLKTATVFCNDPVHSNIVLQLKGTIWKPIDVNPGFAMFNFGPDFQTNQTRILRILSNLEEPVTLSEPAAGNAAFKAELKTLREGKEFELLVTALTPLKMPTVNAPITLKTSVAKMPLLTVNAYATVQPVVTVVPAQITLPAGRLTSASQLTLTIQNNSTNALALSEPAVNSEGTEVRIREMQPGRLFAMTVTFPAGFQAVPGETSVTAKSSDPRVPLVKIPVYQPPLPVSATAGYPGPALSATAPSAPAAPGTQPTQPRMSEPVVQKLTSLTNAPAATFTGPKIQVAEPVFDFGRVESGKTVTNVYVITNRGTQTLEISDVRSSCGCAAAANWTRSVAPGQTGAIPVIFDSGGLAGPLTRSLWLLCNDPGQSNVLLQFKATVWKPIDAIPAVAVFNFGPDLQTEETRVIRLVSNLQNPVTLSTPTCTNHSFRAELTTVRTGKEFELRVTALPPFGAGSWSAAVTLETSAPTMPVVNVTAYAVVQPALTVAPPRVMLPPTPLAKAQQVTVRIQNRGTNALVLSEPSLNAEGVLAQLHEVQAGRLFELTMNFPAGFRPQAGHELEATVKSNKAQSRIIRIPVAAITPLPDSDAPAALGPATRSAETVMSTTAASR